MENITIQTEQELIDLIIKKEKFKSSIAYIAGVISINSVATLYYDDMKVDEVKQDLIRCIKYKGLEQSIKNLSYCTGYKNLSFKNS